MALAASVAIVAVIAERSLEPPFKAAATLQVAQPEPYPLNKRINDYLQAHNSSVYTNGEADFQPLGRVTAYSDK